MAKKPTAKQTRKEWIKWLESYGIGKFYDAFIRTAQYAESVCVYCHEKIYLDIAEGGGIPDWGSAFSTGGLDYGCAESPDTNEDGQGSHKARNLRSAR